MSPEEAVRKFFDCYTNGRPVDFGECVATDYVDYGHTPPWIGPAGARHDYENAVKRADNLINLFTPVTEDAVKRFRGQ